MTNLPADLYEPVARWATREWNLAVAVPLLAYDGDPGRGSGASTSAPG